MSPDGLPQEQSREGGAPAASLTLVRVQRRRSSLQPSRKAGDLTQQLIDGKAPEPAPTPAPPTPARVAITPVSSPPSAPVPAPQPALLAPPEDKTVVILLPEPSEGSAPAPVEVEPAPIVAAAAPEPATLAPSEEPEPAAALAFLPVAEPQPAPLAEPALEMPAVAADATPERDAAPTGADALIDYWDEHAGDRLFPALSELDRGRIAEHWPNTVLLTFGADDMPRMTRLGEPDGEVEYNPMVTDWILSRGRQAAARAEALEEEQRFPVGRGRVRYRLVLLPCSNEGTHVDHMLCHVSRLAEQPKLSAVASFKRWLAS
jgi:hypothetical protein